MNGNPAEAKPKGFAFIRTRLLSFLRLAVVGLVVCILMYGLARKLWFFELATSFTLFHFMVALCAFIGLLLLRAWVSAAVAGLCLAMLAVWIAPYLPYQGASIQAAVGDERVVRVMLMNVLSVNKNTDAAIAEIRRVDPDILCAQEVDEAWVKALTAIEGDYPHKQMVARPDNFGIGLWSRHPILASEIRDLGDATVPAILATLSIHGREVSLLNLHTLPPIMGDYADTRNRQLADVPRIVRKMGEPFLLVGDLNLTMWSPYFSTLEADTGLVNGRYGRGFFPTWNSLSSLYPAFAPIDHILASKDITFLNFERGAHVGSDHYPVFADVQLPPVKQP